MENQKQNYKKIGKKGFAVFYLFFIAIAVVIGYFGIFSTGSAFGGSGTYVQVPYFATIQCVSAGLSTTINAAKNSNLNIPQGGYWLSDFLPSNTNQWNIQLNLNPSFFSTLFASYGVEVYECTARSFESCYYHKTLPEGFSLTDTGGTVQLGGISSSNYIWVQLVGSRAGSKFGLEGGTVQVTYDPYVLQRTDALRGGIQKLSNEIGCTIPNSDPSLATRVLSAVGLKNNIQIYASNNLKPGEAFNYISGTLTTLSDGNVIQNYKGNTGYCIYSNDQYSAKSYAKIYPIGQIGTPSGNYNVVDVTQSPLGTETCCPGDNLPDQTCNSNFQWVSTKNVQCNILNPCEGTDWRRDLNGVQQIIRYQCVSGQCVPQTQKVQCTTSAECSTNQICSTLSWTCVDASAQGSGLVRGVDYLPSSGWPWYVWVAVIIVGIFVLFYFFKFFWPTIRMFLKSIPILGRLVP